MSFAKLVFTPLSYTGWGALEQLFPEVRNFSPKKILVITDPVLEKIGLVQRVTNPLIEHGYDVELYGCRSGAAVRSRREARFFYAPRKF